jgi:hypothetical protein
VPRSNEISGNEIERDALNVTVKADNETIGTTIQIRQHPPIGGFA